MGNVHDRTGQSTRNLMRIAATALLLAAVLAAVASIAGAREPTAQRQAVPPSTQSQSMKILLEFEQTAISATLEDSAAARDFASLLPLTLTLKDYASTEKVADLPRKLSTQGAPAGIDPDVGDIAYYAPWGNLALYYRDFGYSAGLVKLGKIESSVVELQRPGPLKVTIRRAAH